MPWYVLLGLVILLREFLTDRGTVAPAVSESTAGFPDPQMTEHFRWSEFYRPNDQTPPESVISGYAKIANDLELIRGYFGDKPLVITPHGGWHPLDKTGAGWPERSRNSRHRTPEDRAEKFRSGVAVDFSIPGIPIAHVYAGMISLRENRAIPPGGIGLYEKDGFIHWDTRDKAANWTNSINANEGE
jgi:hypothetical protein